MKNWKEYVFDVNGFQINTVYSGEAIETIFLPMLRKLTGMQKKLGRRLIVFLAARGSGKDDIVQVSGISGFAA